MITQINKFGIKMNNIGVDTIVKVLMSERFFKEALCTLQAYVFVLTKCDSVSTSRIHSILIVAIFTIKKAGQID